VARQTLSYAPSLTAALSRVREGVHHTPSSHCNGDALKEFSSELT